MPLPRCHDLIELSCPNPGAARLSLDLYQPAGQAQIYAAPIAASHRILEPHQYIIGTVRSLWDGFHTPLS
jgi:hypothetical protein